MGAKSGSIYVWLSGSMAILSVGMLVVMVVLIVGKGLPQFWPRGLTLVELKDGGRWLGELQDREVDADGDVTSILLKVGNRDVYGLDFKWFDTAEIAEQEMPPDAVAFERLEYGYFFGFVSESLEQVQARAAEATELREQAETLLEAIESRRLPLTEASQELSARKAALLAGFAIPVREIDDLEARVAEMEELLLPELEEPSERLNHLYEKLADMTVEVELADGQTKELGLDQVERLYQPNSMGTIEKSLAYVSELGQFVWDDPRESNTEGGVFPAIFGTVLMVMLMTVAVVPFGVLAAIYMHEYARPGRFLRFIRLSVSNLAGVPSIVFGLFGLGFFIYFVGGGVDRFFFADRLPEPTLGTGGILWASLTLALLTLPSVIVATEEGLAAVPRANRDGSLALGSTKFQMIRHVVVPQAMPGILTGAILAVSRGAGEVAPLMITGVVKLARDMPFSTEFPFFHLDRKFMHLGFHIYDVSMQSPNIEAAKPMVYSTTLLLLIIVLVLNSGAIVLRNRLRRTYRGSAL